MSDLEPTIKVESARTTDAVEIVVAGEIDSSNCAALQDELVRLAATPGDTLCTVDLVGVGFMDSSGLRALLLGQRAMADAGKTMVIVGASDSVRRLLEITGLLERFGLPT
jgi:anti-sigma B factor antagonist